MSKHRLQVLLDPAEYRDMQRLARQQRLTVSEWESGYSDDGSTR
jgi:hypothetical protein